jgi:hypothetical protein
VAPSDFRTPTSRARRTLRAVARLVKLIAAMSRMNTATVPKTKGYAALPVGPIS